MPEEIRINITEIVVLTGRTKGFKLRIDDSEVTIPVDEAVFVNYQNQFYREKPTPDQKKRFATLTSLMRAAYKKGVAEGRKAR